MSGLLVDRQLKNPTNYTVFKNFLFLWDAEDIDDGLNGVRASLVCAYRNKVWLYQP